MKKLILLLCLLPSLCFAASRTLNGNCVLYFDPVAADADLVRDRVCRVPDSATLIEITISADAGTPSVIVQRFRANGATTVDLTSGALATGASGALACSKTGAVTGIDGTTTCSATLQNTSLSKGDWIGIKTGAAHSTATKVSISVVWTW